jgi:hypothetical protein
MKKMKKYKIEQKMWTFNPTTKELLGVSKWMRYRNYRTYEGALDALRAFRRTHTKIAWEERAVLRRFRAVYNVEYIKDLLNAPITSEVGDIFKLGEPGFAPMDDRSVRDVVIDAFNEFYGKK